MLVSPKGLLDSWCRDVICTIHSCSPVPSTMLHEQTRVDGYLLEEGISKQGFPLEPLPYLLFPWGTEYNQHSHRAHIWNL